MVKFLETNQTTCEVPAQAVKQAKANHNKTAGDPQERLCQGAGGPAAGRSDAERRHRRSDPAGRHQPKPGRGIFDTLTGSPLSR